MNRNDQNILKASRNLGIRQNVLFRVIDKDTGKIVQEHCGHNSATNSLLWGIGHHLIGDFFATESSGLSSAASMLGNYVPRYISLGTMGLINQKQDQQGLPAGIGDSIASSGDEEYNRLVEATAAAKAVLQSAIEALEADCKYWPACEACRETECGQRIQSKKDAVEDAQIAYDDALAAQIAYDEDRRFVEYMSHRPGYGADGYDGNQNNGRGVFGLGPTFGDRSDKSTTIKCELISDAFPRSQITFRDIVPEYEAELPKTIDVVFSAMLSTGALSQFRPEGQNFLYITEAGLWSKRSWNNSGENGLLAAYRIGPPNEKNWMMTEQAVIDYVADHPDFDLGGMTEAEYAQHNREILKKSILRVGVNQIVQVVWKIQLGSIDEFTDVATLRKQYFDFY